MTSVPDVVVIGAGRSGLAATRALQARGISPVVLEAGPEPAGWVRELSAGRAFVLIRGFPVDVLSEGGTCSVMSATPAWSGTARRSGCMRPASGRTSTATGRTWSACQAGA
jgi:choline dehydrogenase-like flavoprotein